MKIHIQIQAITLASSLLLGQTAFADDWSGYADISIQSGIYTGTTTKNSSLGVGANLQLDYLEWGGVRLSGSQLAISGTDVSTDYTIDQQAAFVGVYANKYCDTLGGILKFRFDIHQVTLADNFTYKDDVRVYAPQISFINYQKSFYVDMGYAKSTYANGLQLDQFTPTVGFAFNQGSDWLQTRGYFISTSDATLAQGMSSTKAVEIKLTHWTDPGSMFSRLFANALLGERVFAVDGDAAAVYSLADAQQGGGSIGAAWTTAYVDGAIMLSADSYINKTTNATYINSVAYISMSKSW